LLALLVWVIIINSVILEFLIPRAKPDLPFGLELLAPCFLFRSHFHFYSSFFSFYGFNFFKYIRFLLSMDALTLRLQKTARRSTTAALGFVLFGSAYLFHKIEHSKADTRTLFDIFFKTNIRSESPS
jgi:hypothetical protein